VAMRLPKSGRVILLVCFSLPLEAAALAQNLPSRVASRFEAAREAEKKGDYRNAAAAYEAIVKRYPLAEAYSNLGLDYFRLKEFRLAVQVFRDGLKLKPGMVSAQLFLGLSEYSLGDFKASTGDLLSVLKGDGNNREAWLCLIRGEAAVGQFRPADGQMAIKMFPDNPELNYAIGAAALDQILVIAHEAKQMGSSSPAFLWIALREAEQKGETQKMARIRDQIQQAGATISPAIVDQYDQLTNLVQQCFENTVEDAPKSPYAHRIGGQIYEAQGSDVEALREYRAGGDHFAAGRLLAQNLQFKDAEKELVAAIANDPLNRLASGVLAQVYVKEHSPGKALPILHSLLKEYPEDAYAWADLGKAQAQLGQNEDAANSLRKALEIDPSMNELRYVIAIIYRDLGHDDLFKEQMRVFLEDKKHSSGLGGMTGDNDDTEKATAESHDTR
jgi:tetratricopeptide (TPR) repeat protein